MQKILQYEVVRVLGGGAFGTILEGVDPANPEVPVALKMLHKELAQIPEVVQRFFQEAVILAKFDHPQLPKLYTFGPHEDTYVLAQELVEGESLREALQKRKLTIEESSKLLRELLSALQYAHERGVIHRDLKPENLRFSPAGVKVMDFGLARILGAARMSQSGLFVGSLAYAPPEQLKGLEVDARADIFAAGVLLHELLTGQVPHTPKSDHVAVALKAQLDWSESFSRETLRSLLPDVPLWLDAFYCTATAPDPTDRYQSAAEAILALESQSTKAPAASRPGGLQVKFEPTFQQVSFFADDDPLAQMLVELEADAPLQASTKVHADIIMVLDVSGSMNAPDKYPLLRRAVQEFLWKVSPEDRVGIVVFSQGADVVSPLIPGRDASQSATSLITRMDQSPRMFGGGTYLGAGLQHALSTLQKTERKGVRRVYVLTDGELHDTDACQRILQPFREHRIEVHVYGFGSGFNGEALKRLVSDQLGGSVKPICNEQDIIATFAHIASVNSRLIAEDAVFTIEIDEETDCGDAWAFRPQERYLGRIKGRKVERQLGALEAKRVYSMLVELRLPPVKSASEKTTRVGTARLSWQGGQYEAPLFAQRYPAAEQPTEVVPKVTEAFTIADSMRRQGDKAAEISATRARLELARREGRDPGLLEALQKQLDVLEGRTSARALSQSDQQYIAADFSTGC